MIRFLLTRRTLVALLLATCAFAGMADTVPLDENLVALFSDLHITALSNQPHQRAGLSQSVRDVLACNPRPANVLFFGDLSFNCGETNDYRLLKELVQPLEEAGLRWSACLGNHDRLQAFSSVFTDRKGDPALVPGRLVTVVKTPHADFILLDSCLEGPVNGGVDEAQRAWLQETLSRATKPVFVGAHHPIAETGVAGLIRSNAVCTAYLFGHQHAWKQQAEEGVETLCLPSTGHWGDIGYVLVRLNDESAVFTLSQRDYYVPRPAAKPEDIKPEWKQRTEKNNGSQWRVMFKR